MGKEGVIPEKFTDRFREAAKLRNILVYMYTEVDPAILSMILEKNLDDFDKYVQYIAKFLNKKKTVQ